MKQKLIEKIEKSNLSKDSKKQLLEALNNEDYLKFLKILYYFLGIGNDLLDYFSIDLEAIKETIEELLE